MENLPADDLRELEVLVARLREAAHVEPHNRFTFLQKAVHACLITISVRVHRLQRVLTRAAEINKSFPSTATDAAVRQQTRLTLSPILAHLRDIEASVEILTRLAES